MFEIKGKYTTAKVMIDDVEETCISQIHTFLNHKAFTNPIAIMPDTHAGMGSVIGFTMEVTDMIIPNVIGVDIGCGMQSINLEQLELPKFDLLDMRIRSNVPMGFELHERKAVGIDGFPWKRFSLAQAKIRSKFGEGNIDRSSSNKNWFKEICDRVGADINKVLRSVGTLGGGNHFIEFGKDEDTNTWVTVHTGSRNLGLRICNYWQGIATKQIRNESQAEYKTEMAQIKSEFMGKERGIKLKLLKDKYSEKTGNIPKDLEYLTGADSVDYLIDMAFAQLYADWNRSIIIENIMRALKVSKHDQEKLDSVCAVHNFIDFEDMMIRKGAIRSYEGERSVIPFNMRDGLLITEGRSNPEWNYSAPHGAGRVLSRSAAKRELNQTDADQQMKDAGIFTSNVPLDEAPEAYKDAKIIEEALTPTATILKKIKPILNIKA